MELETLKKCTDWFKVREIKDIVDPSGQVARKELVVALDQYPYDFGYGPNPREPDPSSRVSKRIGETLKENWQNFHLLNRGVVIVAKQIEYDNKSQRVRLTLDETEDENKTYGILDGGNTTKRINIWREGLSDAEAEEQLPQTFLNVQILIPQLGGAEELPPGMVDLLNDVKDARNTSVQVKTKSLADARRHFDALKAALEKEPYYNQISWHEGQGGPGSIDALQIVILLMIYYPSFSKAIDREPSNAYGHKESCLDAFLGYSENEPEELEKWITLLPKMLRLFDRLQLTFPDYYEGRFGKINDVQIYDEKQYQKGSKKYRKTPVRTQFLGADMKYSYPQGWIYPLYASFRFLAAPDGSGNISWREDPVIFWNKHAKEITSSYVPHIIAAGYDAKKIATNPLCYQAVRQKVTDLFKNELLLKAGIAI